MSNTGRPEQTHYNSHKHKNTSSTPDYIPDMLALALKSGQLKVKVAETIWIKMKANEYKKKNQSRDSECRGRQRE